MSKHFASSNFNESEDYGENKSYETKDNQQRSSTPTQSTTTIVPVRSAPPPPIQATLKQKEQNANDDESNNENQLAENVVYNDAYYPCYDQSGSYNQSYDNYNQQDYNTNPYQTSYNSQVTCETYQQPTEPFYGNNCAETGYNNYNAKSYNTNNYNSYNSENYNNYSTQSHDNSQHDNYSNEQYNSEQYNVQYNYNNADSSLQATASETVKEQAQEYSTTPYDTSIYGSKPVYNIDSNVCNSSGFESYGQPQYATNCDEQQYDNVNVTTNFYNQDEEVPKTEVPQAAPMQFMQPILPAQRTRTPDPFSWEAQETAYATHGTAVPPSRPFPMTPSPVSYTPPINEDDLQSHTSINYDESNETNDVKKTSKSKKFLFLFYFFTT